MKRDAALAQISSVTPDEIERYVRYLGRITPTNHEDLFRRWLFAFASVHTTWKLNCKMYYALADLHWIGDRDRLHKLIRDTGAGLHNNRTRFIHGFSDYYWAHPDWFWKAKAETWVQFRDRIQEAALGVGRAKSSFVVELAYPTAAEVICTDTHVMQLYGRSPSEISKKGIPDREERAMESHWVNACKRRSVPPVLARWIFWDKKQGYSDSRYWTCVFEREDFHAIFKKYTLQGGEAARGPDHPGLGQAVDSGFVAAAG